MEGACPVQALFIWGTRAVESRSEDSVLRVGSTALGRYAESKSKRGCSHEDMANIAGRLGRVGKVGNEPNQERHSDRWKRLDDHLGEGPVALEPVGDKSPLRSLTLANSSIGEIACPWLLLSANLSKVTR